MLVGSTPKRADTVHQFHKTATRVSLRALSSLRKVNHQFMPRRNRECIFQVKPDPLAYCQLWQGQGGTCVDKGEGFNHRWSGGDHVHARRQTKTNIFEVVWRKSRGLECNRLDEVEAFQICRLIEGLAALSAIIATKGHSILVPGGVSHIAEHLKFSRATPRVEIRDGGLQRNRQV